jgi:L-alanine-DL-glutamate epimerase-like enolase superfamily enzyme
MPFVERLKTSFGEEPFKTAIIVKLNTTSGLVLAGEAPLEIKPGYINETMENPPACAVGASWRRR